MVNGELVTDVCPNYEPGTIAVAALLFDGALDTKWGIDGCSSALTDPSGNSDDPYVQSLTIVPGNDVLVVANSGDYGVAPFDSWMAKVTAGGQIDTTFGTGTTVMVPTPLNGGAIGTVQSVAVSPASGDVVLVSAGRWDGDPEYSSVGAVASVLPDGATDTSFGTGGLVDLPPTLDTVGIEVQPNYRVVVSGTTGSSQCVNGPQVPDPADVASAPDHGPYACQALLLGYTDPNL